MLRPMGRGWFVAVVVVASLSGCTHRFECRAHGGDEVRRIESEHFVVASDLPLATMRAETRKLEQLWDAWVVFFGHAPEGSARLQVVLSPPGASSEFIENTAGFVRFAVPALLFSTVTVTTGTDGKEVSYSSNAHELVHLVSHFWLPRQPRWLSEGLATYLGDARFVRDSVIRMGRWQWEGGTVDSLDDLWAWDQVHEEVERERVLYKSAWAWIHYFSNRDEGRLARLWALLPKRASPRAAFEEIFPREEWPALKVKVQAYLDEGRYRGWETRVTREPELGEATTLAPWEVHLLRRSYLDSSRKRRDETRKALALTPTPTAELVLARFEDEYRGPELSTVLDALPNDPRAMQLAAQAPDLPPRRRFQLLEQALDARPDDVTLLADFAFEALQRNDPRALEAAEKAIALAPWWPAPHFQRARALAQAHRCEDARQALDEIEGLVNDGNARLPQQIANARALLKKTCEVAP